jgi:hypothetical protein
MLDIAQNESHMKTQEIRDLDTKSRMALNDSMMHEGRM